ncbi:MAG: CHAD domain-containing protein [Cyanobacteria bacterium P01_H01_bin.121]
MAKTKLKKIETLTLSRAAQGAIAQQFKQIVRSEPDVLNDVDPEAIHQMRVGLRRLRTSLRVFGTCLDLPRAAQEKQVKAIAGCLGRVRDLDVLIEELESHYFSALPAAEQEYLATILAKLRTRRYKRFKQASTLLTGSTYSSFKEAYQDWLAAPQFNQIASLPAIDRVPDLLLPWYCQVLQHPGWLIATHITEQHEVRVRLLGSYLHQELEQAAIPLHDLRKQIKQVRYQSELFVDCYGDRFRTVLQGLKLAQDLLGGLQDIDVFRTTIKTLLKGNTETKLPSLMAQLRESQASLWRDWQPLQQRYLDPAFRAGIRVVLTQTMAATAPSVTAPPVTKGGKGKHSGKQHSSDSRKRSHNGSNSSRNGIKQGTSGNRSQAVTGK